MSEAKGGGRRAWLLGECEPQLRAAFDQPQERQGHEREHDPEQNRVANEDPEPAGPVQRHEIGAGSRSLAGARLRRGLVAGLRLLTHFGDGHPSLDSAASSDGGSCCCVTSRARWSCWKASARSLPIAIAGQVIVGRVERRFVRGLRRGEPRRAKLGELLAVLRGDLFVYEELIAVCRVPSYGERLRRPPDGLESWGVRPGLRNAAAPPARRAPACKSLAAPRTTFGAPASGRRSSFGPRTRASIYGAPAAGRGQ
jgi:hypothetical protein